MWVCLKIQKGSYRHCVTLKLQNEVLAARKQLGWFKEHLVVTYSTVRKMT